MSYDNACKYLSEKYPAQFAAWILGKTPASIEVLKTELSIEPIRADYVTFLRTPEQILHLEFEVDVEGEPPLPLRMLDYWVRLYRRYRLPVIQALVLLKETPAAQRLKDNFRLDKTRHHYQIIRLWEADAEIFLQSPALLPLAALCRTNTPESLLIQVSNELGKIAPSTEREQISACINILAGLRFTKDIINQLFREEIMQESVTYQHILQKGVQQGLQQGLEQGVQQGLQQGLQQAQQSLKNSILEALETRFGIVPPEIVQQLEVLTIVQLQGLIRQSWTCGTIDEFINQLG